MPWEDAAARFHQEHQRVYGYADAARAVQTVTLRLRATLAVERPSLAVPRSRKKGAGVVRKVWVAGKWRQVPVVERETIGTKPLQGPALVADYGSTTLVPPGWTMRSDAAANLLLTKA